MPGTARVPRARRRREAPKTAELVPPRDLRRTVDEIIFRYDHHTSLIGAGKPPPTLQIPPNCRPSVMRRPHGYEDAALFVEQRDGLSFWGVWFIAAAAMRFKRPIRRQRRQRKEAEAKQQVAQLHALATSTARPEDFGIFAQRVTAGRDYLARSVRASAAALLCERTRPGRDQATRDARDQVPCVPLQLTDVDPPPTSPRAGTARRPAPPLPKRHAVGGVPPPQVILDRLQRLTTPRPSGSKTAPVVPGAGSLARSWRRPPTVATLGDFMYGGGGVEASSGSLTGSPNEASVRSRPRPAPIATPQSSLGLPSSPRRASSGSSTGSISGPFAARDEDVSWLQSEFSSPAPIGFATPRIVFNAGMAGIATATPDLEMAEDDALDASLPAPSVVDQGRLLDGGNTAAKATPTPRAVNRRQAFLPRHEQPIFSDHEFSDIPLPRPVVHPFASYPPPDRTRQLAHHRLHVAARLAAADGPTRTPTQPVMAAAAKASFDRFRAELHRQQCEFHRDELARLQVASERRSQALALKRDFLQFHCEHSEVTSAQDLGVELKRFVRDARMQAAHGKELENRVAWFYDFYQRITDVCAAPNVYTVLQTLQAHFETLEDEPLQPSRFKAIVDSITDDDLMTREVQFVLRHAAKAFGINYVTFREVLEKRHVQFVLQGSIGE
jgi:hypothetical protein